MAEYMKYKESFQSYFSLIKSLLHNRVLFEKIYTFNPILVWLNPSIVWLP